MSNTGEHAVADTNMPEQNPTIGTSSTVTVGLLVTLLVAAAAAGAAHWRIGENERRQDKIESRLEAMAERNAVADTDVALLKQDIGTIKQGVADLNRKFDEQNEVRPAGGHR